MWADVEEDAGDAEGRGHAAPPRRRCPFVLHSCISSDNTASPDPTRPDSCDAALRLVSVFWSHSREHRRVLFIWVTSRHFLGKYTGKFDRQNSKRFTLVWGDFFVFCESDECLMETDLPNVRLTWLICCFHVCRNVSVSCRLVWTDKQTKKPADMQEESQLALSKVIPERRSPFCLLVC